MKKQTKKKLSLNKKTINVLTTQDSSKLAGGDDTTDTGPLTQVSVNGQTCMCSGPNCTNFCTIMGPSTQCVGAVTTRCPSNTCPTR